MEGFEPSGRLPGQLLSGEPHSATLPHLPERCIRISGPDSQIHACAGLDLNQQCLPPGSRFYRPLQSPAMRTDPYGGTGWNRTNDTLGFNQVLYQLSYSSIWRRAQNSNLTPCGAIRLAGGPQTFWVHSPSMAGVVGFEPTNAGVRDRCLDRLATPQ